MIHTNIDILLYGSNEITLFLSRVLKKYISLSLYNTSSIGEILPDIIILSEQNPYLGLSEYNTLSSKYTNAKFVYIRETYDITALGCLFCYGIDFFLTTDMSSEHIVHCLNQVFLSPKTYISGKYRTQFLNANYNKTIFSVKELIVLGGKLRGISTRKLSKLFNIGEKNINFLLSKAYAKLGQNGSSVQNIDNIIKFASIQPIEKTKRYNIPKTRKHRYDYFIIPRVYDE